MKRSGWVCRRCWERGVVEHRLMIYGGTIRDDCGYSGAMVRCPAGHSEYVGAVHPWLNWQRARAEAVLRVSFDAHPPARHGLRVPLFAWSCFACGWLVGALFEVVR